MTAVKFLNIYQSCKYIFEIQQNIIYDASNNNYCRLKFSIKLCRDLLKNRN